MIFPKGMEIDAEKSDLINGIIKFKPKSITYEDIYHKLDSKDFSNILVHKDYKDKLTAISQFENIFFKYFSGAQDVINNPNFREILDAIYKN